MDKQGSMRQSGSASQRSLARSGTMTSRRMDTTKSLLQQSSHRRLHHSPSGVAQDSGAVAAENEQLHGNNAAPASTSSFDKLEQLGPSLLEVLTLVHPPQPRAQQEQLDANIQQQQQQQQQAGDNDAMHDTSESNQYTEQQSSHSTSDAASERTKFAPCVSRSALIGELADASADNARKAQEYFAKLLATLAIEATGLVLLQDATILLYLETSAEHFVALCRALQHQSIVVPATMRVLASCDDTPGRLLQGLYFKKVAITHHDSSDTEWPESSDDNAVEQRAIALFLNLVKFVKKVGQLAPVDIRKCLTNLAISDQLLLPPNDVVLSLLARDELFMTLDEFLDVYASPIALELESERVWPVHPLIHY